MRRLHPSGQHSKTRKAVAGVLTAAALLIAPLGISIAVPGTANAVTPGNGPTGPNPGGDGPGGPIGGGDTPGVGGFGSAASTVQKLVYYFPGFKIEVSNYIGDLRLPTIKIVQTPGTN